MEKLSNTTENAFSGYIKTREEYYRNFEIAYSNKEFRKASELLWGVITQSIKALASLSGHRWMDHSGFFNFTREISREVSDPEYHKLFLRLNDLHRNFYDEEIDVIDFPLYVDDARLFIGKTQKLIEKKIEKIKKEKNGNKTL